jgi:serine/threonine protein kinase
VGVRPLTDHPESPITADSGEAALDAGLAAAFGPDGTGDYKSRSVAEETVGTVIAGKYKLLERIGEGGMGSVWMAQQTEPVKRHVAVKLIKSGMDSKQVLARFEAERQALAVMDHPNIAKILDGGVAENGAPYFVMELVKGISITKYCDEHKLTPRQRLELFVPVCQAIQHAHQKGIIHRDIKPSNVMVALYDDKPIPKVIDFGVAKATGQALTDQTLNTGFGGIAGTPQYMSPEQATLNNLDIDTRSDIYSLGVLLYELLTGSPPFAQKDLEKAGMLEILRVIREEEPLRPSTKLSTADALPSLSANRGTEPKKLTGILRNELDWIVMKALEKDRTRRYETANGFAADINRYLAGEPVNAHPPSAGYRMKKFLRKHKGPVFAVVLVAISLSAGVVSTSLGWHRAIAERHQKELALEAAELARDSAKVNASRASKETAAVMYVLGLVKDTFRLENAQEQLEFVRRDRKTRPLEYPTYAELMERISTNWTADKIEQQFPGDFHTAGPVLRTIGVLLRDTGHNESAIPLLERACDRSLASFKMGAIKQITLVYCQRELAAAYRVAGRYTEALELYTRVLAALDELSGIEHPNTIDTASWLAATFLEVDKFADAEPLLRMVFEYRKMKQPTSWTTFSTQSLIGTSLLGAKKYADSEPMLLAGYEGMTQVASTIPKNSKFRVTETLDQLVQLYTAWHAAEPGKGYDVKAAEWKAKLEAMKPPEKK